MATTPALNEASVPVVASGPVQGVISASEETFIRPTVEDSTRALAPLPLSDLFGRDILILRQALSSSDTAHTPMLGYFDPLWKYLTSDFVVAHMANYRQFRGGLHLTVRMSTPGLCVGAYIMQAICEGGPAQELFEVDDYHKDNIFTSTQDEFGILNAEMSNVLEFDLPWVSWLLSQQLPTMGAGEPRCWRLQLYPLAPLQSTTSTAVTGTIEVFARLMPGYELGNSFLEGRDRFPVGARTGAVSSSVGQIAAGISGLGGGLPFIAPLARPLASALDALGGVASWFGYTREPAPKEPQPMLTSRLFSSLAHVDGCDTGEPTGLYAGNALSTDPRVGGGEGEDVASFESLFKRWTYMGGFTVPDTMAVGPVGWVPVTPYLYTTTATGAMVTTTAGYVGTPFTQWKGSMEYLIYIPSGPTVRGRMLVCWDPQQTTGPPAYPVDPSQFVKNVAIDLCCTSSTVVRVDMAQEWPSFEADYATFGDTGAVVNGYLAFYLQVPLTCTKTTGFSLKFCVFARAAGNMRFGVPSVYTSSGPLHNLRLEGKDFPQPVEESQHTLAGPIDPVSGRDVLWGEEMESVRPLVQKFTDLYFGKAFTDNQSVAFTHYPPPCCDFTINPLAAHPTYVQLSTDGTAANAPTRCPFLWDGFYCPLFVGVRGSMRFKMYMLSGGTKVLAFPARGALLGGVRSTAFTAYDATFTGLIVPFGDTQSIASASGCEWVFPAYGGALHNNPRSKTIVVTPTGSSTQYTPVVNAVFPMSQFGTAIVYTFRAMGPDVVFVRFRRTPAFRFS